MSEIAVKLNGGGNLTEAMKQARRAVDEVKESLGDIGQHKKVFEQIVNSGKPLQTQLRQIKKLLGEMQFQGLGGSEEFQKITRLAGEMADAIGDASQSVNYFANDTKTLSTVVEGFQAVAGAISIAQGGLAMFGVENEKVEQTLKKVQGALAMVNGVQAVANTLNKNSNLIMGIANLQKSLAVKWSKAHGGALLAEAAATKGATIATRALNTVLKANPIGLVITAVTTLIGLFTIFSGKSDDAKDKVSELAEEANHLREEHTHAMETISSKVADTTSKFVKLSIEWKTLRSDAERTAWIQNNANAFKALGLNIKTVTDANEVFIRQFPKILNVLKIQAEAEATLDLYIEQFKKRQARLANPNQQNGGFRADPVATWNRILSGRDENGQQLSHRQIQNQLYDLANKYELVQGVDYEHGIYADTTGKLTQQGIEKLIKITTEDAQERARKLQEREQTQMDYYYGQYTKLTQDAVNAVKEIPQMYIPSTSADPYKAAKEATTKVRTPKVNKAVVKEATPAKELKQEYDKKLTELEQLIKERDEIIAKLNNKSLSTGERHFLKNDLEDINKRIDYLKSYKEGMAYVKDLEDNVLVMPLEIEIDKEKFNEEVKKTIKEIDLSGLEPIDIDKLLGLDKKTIDISNNAKNGINQVLSWFDADLIGKTKAEEMINAFNAQLLAVGLEPITINLDTEKFKSDAEKVSSTIGNISGAVAQAFGAMNDALSDSKEQDVALNAAKIIAQAVATLALSFAQAMGKEGKSGVWGWIAAGITGMATLMTMVGQLNKLNTYATGGIVGGNSYVGDRQLIRVNSGEMVLNKRQQSNLFNVLDGHGAVRGNTSSEITWRLRGADIYGSLKNYNTTKGLTR